jgi:hypothetical protein
MFSIAKIIFFIIQSAQKYNNNNNNTKKISGQKIRTEDIVVAVFVLYHCAVDASTLHAAWHDTTRLRWRPTFSIIFLGERRARYDKRKNTCLMKLINVSINNKMN